MSQVTAGMIKELRGKTGVGMAKCKVALQDASGDMEQAIIILRKAGMASAAKKEGRETKEGSIGTAEVNSVVSLVEVNAETDFVVNNEIFQKFIADMAKEVAETRPASVEIFSEQKFSGDKELTIDQYRSIIIQKIGENIQIRRVATFEKKPNVSMGVYSHMGGKIIALVELTGSEDQTGCARNLAMHVAAARPQYLTPDSVPEDIRARELDIAREQVKDKPEHIMDKILDGKMRAFESDTCMVSQRYVRDDKRTVQEFIDSCGKESGSALSVANFVYWKVGE